MDMGKWLRPRVQDNLQQDRSWTEPEKTSVSNSSIATYEGKVRWDSVPFNFCMERDYKRVQFHGNNKVSEDVLYEKLTVLSYSSPVLYAKMIYSSKITWLNLMKLYERVNI